MMNKQDKAKAAAIGYAPYKMPTDTCGNCGYYGHRLEIDDMFQRIMSSYGPQGVINAELKGCVFDKDGKYSKNKYCLLGEFELKSAGGICPSHKRKT